MNHLKLFLYFSILSCLLACKREDVKAYAATESYPNDNYLEALNCKKAMVVIAHDDDMCAMSGTMSKLNKAGWEIEILSLNKGESRNTAHRKACRNFADTVHFMSFTSETLYIDYDLERTAYEALPKSKFKQVFKVAEVKAELKLKIQAYQPSIIFTLDHEFGGYGHPEHILISQTVYDLYREKQIQPLAIYQSVYTDHMENTIMKRHEKRMKSWGFDGLGWERAKTAYKTSGMPEPTVQISIVSEAETKMNYLLSYNKRERKTMGFFIPAFEDYTAKEYFGIFDREFYRIISTEEASDAANSWCKE